MIVQLKKIETGRTWAQSVKAIRNVVGSLRAAVGFVNAGTIELLPDGNILDADIDWAVGKLIDLDVVESIIT